MLKNIKFILNVSYFKKFKYFKLNPYTHNLFSENNVFFFLLKISSSFIKEESLLT